MKLITLLLLAIMSVVMAGPIEATKLTDAQLKDSFDFIDNVQGDNKDLYVIVFTNSAKDYTADLETAFTTAAEDEELAELEIYSDDFDNEWGYKYGQIDVRQIEQFGDAIQVLNGGKTDTSNLTFPIYLIVKEGHGVKGSMTGVLNADGVANTAFKTKLKEVSKAKKAKAKAPSDSGDEGEGDDVPVDGGEGEGDAAAE